MIKLSYEPKAVDFVTTNGKHILIYDYLADIEFSIKLANNLVIAVEPHLDEITMLMPDKNDVYDAFTRIQSAKPTALSLELFVSQEGLFEIIENSPPGFQKMRYFHKTRFTPYSETQE